MYQSVYNTKNLKQKEVLQMFNNILANSGNKVVNKLFYGMDKPLNIINFLKVKNLLPLITFAEEDINIKHCCLHLDTNELLVKLYSNLGSFDPGNTNSNNWNCTTLYCSQPQNLYVSYVTNTTAVIGWDMIFGESYDVYQDGFILQTNATSPITLTDLTELTEYTIRISSGENDECNSEITFTTAGEQPNLVYSWNKLAGESVNLVGKIDGSFTRVDWGDGIVDTMLSHTYISDGNYTVGFYASTATIMLLGNKLGPSVNNITAVTKIPPTLTSIDLSTNFITSIPSLIPLTGLITLLINKNQLTTLNISANTALDKVIASDNLITGVLPIATNTLLTWMEIDRNQLTGATGVASCPGLLLYQIGFNKIGVTDVNNALIALASGGLLNGRCVTQGQTPAAAPTGAGATAVATLITNSWTVNTD